jgi:stage V sporulation protein AB
LYIGLLVWMGLAGGLVVGSGLVAILTVLDIIPRLVQLSKSKEVLPWFELAVVVGAISWTAADFFDWQAAGLFAGIGGTVGQWIVEGMLVFIVAGVGLMAGAFVGMLAGALTEVLNVLPILAKRVHIGGAILWLLLAMIAGKVVGSLVDWFVM